MKANGWLGVHIMWSIGIVGLALAMPSHATPATAGNGVPEIFAPGVISGPANDADAAFTPDGDTVYFSRNATIMVSRRSGATWSTPEIAEFSGQWNDQQPTIAPDGSFIVFVSNRPIGEHDAKGPAGNLWRTNRQGDGWSNPIHLPATVNRDNSTWAPSIAGDGSLYFIERANAKAPFRLWRSQYRNGQYEEATAVSFDDATTQDVDPAVAPDESFIVYGSMHPGKDQHERLFIVFRENGQWGKPIDLGAAINGNGSNDANEARLSTDHRTLYFSTDRTLPISFPRSRKQAEDDLNRIQAWDNGNMNIWSVSLAPWLEAHQIY